jgi:branched-subunit amino acid ABC-type transport system permease component
MQLLNNLEILSSVPVLNIGLLIDGLLIGSVFALAAYGLALVWGVMNVKNLAQGDFVIMGGYTSWLLASYGIHPLIGVPVAFCATSVSIAATTSISRSTSQSSLPFFDAWTRAPIL